MFNLLMFNNIDWSSDRVAVVPLQRLFEYTEHDIKTRLGDLIDQAVLDRVSRWPCLFCEEGTNEELAYVGQINRARLVGREVRLEISLDSEVPPQRNSVLFEKRNELDMSSEWEFSRNHWAVKEVDLYRFLLRNVRPRRQRPSVFHIPEHESIESELVSAMMPFDVAFSDVYESIKLAAGNVGLRCRRADDIWENPAIIQDVVSLIDRSRIVVCDCTGRNPNVFYEAGIAHTLGREVILVSQSEHDIPFDLRHLRYVRYLNNTEGRADLARALEERMRTLMGH